MKITALNPDQIITLNDYPLYSHSVFRKYYSKCKNGEDLAFVPLISKDIVKKHFYAELPPSSGNLKSIIPQPYILCWMEQSQNNRIDTCRAYDCGNHLRNR